MGNTDTKLNFRKAVVQLTTKTQPVEAGDEAFWSQFWSDSVTCVQDVFTLIPAAEIRALREESPSNLATLCYKAVEKLVQAAESGCRSQREQQTVLNCLRLLTRILPYIFEDPDWRGFFWSTLPGQNADDSGENESSPLAQSLLNAMADLLFCPEFTVAPNRKSGPDNPEDVQTIDSCEYIWEAGVGFAHSPPGGAMYDSNRQEILKLVLTCYSETMYLPPVADAHAHPNQWIGYFTSTENRHALPLFTSLLNVVCAYDPIGYGVPYNHLMFTDAREPLVEIALQVLCVTLDNDPTGNMNSASTEGTSGGPINEQGDVGGPDNLFVNYLSRIHREEDFAFILKGITRLLNNPLTQTYLPGSCKKVQFHQELLVLFWKMCDINKKFMFYVLKSSDVLDILVPILYFLNDARADQSRVGLMHIGVFILLLLSGERNFGVRLNKPYTVRVPMDIAVFTGTHADFLIIVFHKIITTGHQKLQPLFDCLLTIIVNVSPYLKTLSMVASTKMLHLLEAFSTPWFLYASPTNHHLVFFLLEVFNNIIQYQFDGNSNLVYTIIRKRNVFHQLANLPTDNSAIARALTKRGKKFVHQPVDHSEQSMEGSIPAAEAEPGTLKVTLAATPVPPCQLACYKLAHPLAEHIPEAAFTHDTDYLEQVCDPVMASENSLIELSHDSDFQDPWEQMIKLTRSKSQVDLHELQAELDPSRKRHNSDSESLLYARRQRSLSMPNCHDLVGKHVDSIPHTASFDHWYESFWKAWSKGEYHNNKRKKKSVKIAEEANQVIEIVVDQESQVKQRLAEMLGLYKPIVTERRDMIPPMSRINVTGIDKMTEKARASASHIDQQTLHHDGEEVEGEEEAGEPGAEARPPDSGPEGQSEGEASLDHDPDRPQLSRAKSLPTPPASPTSSVSEDPRDALGRNPLLRAGSTSSAHGGWVPTPDWVGSWKQKLPLQTIMRLLQVLVPQVEKICIDKGLTDESEILKFLQHGTLVGLLPVPHPILIRKYQANSGTTMWFRTYMWGVIYLRNVDPPVWYDTDVKLFEIQRV